MMTGFSLEQLVAQAVENGALGVLRKPFEIKDLLDVLEQVKPRGMVLVADDDPEFAASLEPILTQHGYRVRDRQHRARRRSRRPRTTASTASSSTSRCRCCPASRSTCKLKDAGRAVPTIFVTGFPGERNLALRASAARRSTRTS